MNNLDINNQLDEVTKNIILNMEKEIESKDKEIVYTRKKLLKDTGKKDNLSNLEIVTIEHKLSQEEYKCSKCNSSLVVIGKKEKDILKYIPAKLYIERHVNYGYACNIIQ